MAPIIDATNHIIDDQFLYWVIRMKPRWEWRVLEALATPLHCSSVITC